MKSNVRSIHKQKGVPAGSEENYFEYIKEQILNDKIKHNLLSGGKKLY